MKKQKLLLFATTICMLFFLEIKNAHATTLRVNNNGTIYTQWINHEVFNDLASAVAAATPGDTIHLEASPTSYSGSGAGAIHFSKKLIIIGPGYLLGGATGNMNQQVNPTTAKLSDVYFDPGSEFSILTGVQIGTGSSTLHIKASNITIKRNYFQANLYLDNTNTISNLIISQNYFDSGSIQQTTGAAAINSSIISNNIIESTNLTLLNNFQGSIIQNVFNGTNISIFGNQFYNNIVSRTTIGFTQNNNDTTTIHNNVFTYAAPVFLPTPNSNTFIFPSANLFTTGGSSDGNYSVNQVCLPCLNNGAFGYEMGIYGGAPGTEYKLSGVPNVPAIYQLFANPSIICGDTVNVQIKTRSNN